MQAATAEVRSNLKRWIPGIESCLEDHASRSNAGNVIAKDLDVVPRLDPICRGVATFCVDRSTAGILTEEFNEILNHIRLLLVTEASPDLIVISEGWPDETEDPRYDLRTLDLPGKVYALRRLTGLSWAQIASLMRVQPRTVHYWATGREISPKNEERLARILAAVMWIDRGSSSQNRSLLLSPHQDGSTYFDLLKEERHEELKRRVGRGPGSRRRLEPLTQETRRHIGPERFGEMLERAAESASLLTADGDGIVQRKPTVRKTKRFSKTRSD
jgi:hypothetical protein